MPEARDRLLRRNHDVAEMYSRRRAFMDRTGIIPEGNDESERIIIQTPFRWGSTPLTGGSSGQLLRGGFPTRPVTTRGGGTGRGLFGSPATVYRRGRRNQNTPPSGSGIRRSRGARTGSHSNSTLPSWYPRTPLGDITGIVRTMERRRGRLGNGEGQTPTPIRVYQQPADQDHSTSGARLEHKQHGNEFSLVTPKPTLLYKTFKPSMLGKVPLILADICKQDDKELGFLTPQKKLLNSIDMVEKVVMEELNRMKRTPSAKRAEKEKRVRTLMSMR